MNKSDGFHGRWNWRIMALIKALIFFAVAIYAGVKNIHWGIVCTYALTGIILFMAGALADIYNGARFLSPMEVLLRHEGKAWVLTIMRRLSDEQVFAPQDAVLRVMREVDLREMPETILGCPKFTKVFGGYMVLGQIYRLPEQGEVA